MRYLKSNLIKIGGFIVFLLIILFFANHILEDKGTKKNLYAVRYEPKDTIDIIFLGNSHANNAFLPMEIWEKYGYTAYSMTQMSQTFPLVYYCAEDAVKLQHPKLLVVDLFAATSFSNDFDNMHRTIDNLTFSTRMEAIREFVPKEKRTEYYFPLYLYHDRWSELEIKDFLPYFLRYAPKRNGRKGATLVSDWNSCEVPLDAVKCAEDGIAAEGLPETNVIWYNRLKRLCDDSGTELLFVVVPYQMPIGGSEENTVKQMKMFNATEDWCRDNGVGYLNLFRNLEDMGIDFSADMQDVSHVNLLGAQKVTETVGEYISKNYDISHNRDNTTEAVWNGYLETYLAEKNAAMDVLEKNIGK